MSLDYSYHYGYMENAGEVVLTAVTAGIHRDTVSKIEDSNIELQMAADSLPRRIERASIRRLKEGGNDELINGLLDENSSLKKDLDNIHKEYDRNFRQLQTSSALSSKLKKRIQDLSEGYSGAAKLACELCRRGPKNGNPWSEAEILALSEEIGVSIKGDCLKAFKAGMPAELVKKDAGARPITPREESPDDVES